MNKQKKIDKHWKSVAAYRRARRAVKIAVIIILLVTAAAVSVSLCACCGWLE